MKNPLKNNSKCTDAQMAFFSTPFPLFCSFFCIRNQKKIISGLLTALIVSLFAASQATAQDRAFIQGFYWDVSPGAVWYDSLAFHAEALGRAGFDAIWLPPPSKGGGGGFDVGYTPYDYYDLGEFDSWPGDVSPGDGSGIPTRYGTRTQLERAIQALQGSGLDVYMDIVLNHRSGGILEANPFVEYYTDRDGGSLYSPDGDSTYTAFPLTHGSGRIAWKPGDGADFFFPNAVRNPDNTFDFFSDNQLSGFHQMYINNFGYQNALHNGDGSTLPLGDSLMVWGDWLTSTLGIDGYRFDFVKGIHPEYLKAFVDYGNNKNRFHVHELYDGSIDRLKTYLNMLDGSAKPPAVFDFNIRFAYKEWSDGGEGYDIRNLHGRGLYNHGVAYEQIVPFIDNHDFDRLNYRNEVTEPGHSPVINQKNLIYAHMLTHPGIPQVWWRDYFYYGLRDEINLLMAIRKQFASGGHHILTAREDVFWPGFQPTDERNVYVMQRDGINDDTGLILAINKHPEYNIDVWVTNIRDDWRDRKLIDLTGNISDTLQVYPDSRVLIPTNAGSWSVFVPVDYDFQIDTGVHLSQITGLLDDYFTGEPIRAGVSLESRATLSEEATVHFHVYPTDDSASAYPLDLSDPVHQETLTVTLSGGEKRNLSFSEFQIDVPGMYRAKIQLDEGDNENNNHQVLSKDFEVIDPDQAVMVGVNGRLTFPGYRLMASPLNNNAGFGPGKNLDGLYFFDDADSVYIGVDGVLVLEDADAIGLMFDFSERKSVPAGTPLGGIPGASGFLATDEYDDANNFTMDFNVDLGMTFYGTADPEGAGRRIILSVVDYSLSDTAVNQNTHHKTESGTVQRKELSGNALPPPARETGAKGFMVRTASESAKDAGPAVSGPAEDAIFPENTITYAVRNTGEKKEGYEIAISKEALGIQEGSVRGFAFIVSNTAWFSNVTLPGNLEGDADEFGNPGFGTKLHLKTGGPFHSSEFALGSDETTLPNPILTSPVDGTYTGVTIPFLWSSVADAEQYRIQAATSLDNLLSGNHFLDENLPADVYGGDTPYIFDPESLDTPPSVVAWRVKTRTDNKTSEWSTPALFDYIFSSAVDSSPDIPVATTLYGNYPNPFNPSTIIRFGLPKQTEIGLYLYSVDGRLVQKLKQGVYPAGYHQIEFNAGNLSSGIYIYRLEAGNETLTRRMTFIK